MFAEKTFCFQFVFKDNYTSGDWFSIELPKALNYSFVGLEKEEKDLFVATLNSLKVLSQVLVFFSIGLEIPC